MMEERVDTMELKPLHKKFFKMGTIGQHYLEMPMHMHKSEKISKP